MQHVRIMDIPFINESKINVLKSIHNAIQNKNKKFIVTANPGIVMETRKDKDYKSIIQSADYIIPDGIGILLAAKRKKTPIKERLPGVELMEDMLEYANTHKITCYFLGAEAKVNHALVNKVKMDYPDLIIGGAHYGFFDLNYTSIVEGVKNSNADIIFVALGFPRQEKWIYQDYENFDKGVFMGVGGSFDVISETVKRAPKLWIKLNLEWLYRIIIQPTRVNRIFVVIKFLLLALFKK